MQSPLRLPASQSSLRREWAWGLLCVIVLLGGWLRFTGLNWDSFAGSHPDERFLTVNLLPLVGGNLEPTPDNTRFPPWKTVVRSLDRFEYRGDVFADATALVGVMPDTLGADYAVWWVGSERVRTYETADAAFQALSNKQVAAVVVDNLTPYPVDSSVKDLEDPISSEEIQRARCVALYPETNGAGGYFDALCSPLNPHNAGAGFYAYGTLPLFLAHVVSDAVLSLQSSNPETFVYPGSAMIWRTLSAIFDVGGIILLFFIGSRLHTRHVGLIAALLYAVAPLAIQKAHFGTVNAITHFFVILAFWAAAGVQDRGRYYYYAMFGFAFGSALAGRINVVPLVGVVGLAAIVQALPAFDRQVAGGERLRVLSGAVSGLMLAGVVTIGVFRLANPYAFTGPGILGILPNPRFLDDLAISQFNVSGKQDSPPNYQWVGRMDYVIPLKDIVLWGMGIASGVLAWVGVAWSGWQLLARRPGATRNLFLVAWVLVYFAFMGRQWVMTMRYFLPLYGAFALLAAWTIVELVRASREGRLPLSRLLLGGYATALACVPAYYVVNSIALTTTALASGVLAIILLGCALFLHSTARAYALGVFAIGFSVLWGLMFSNIYRHELTRVQASRWVIENVPSDFAMQIEGAPAGTPLVNLAIRNRGGGIGSGNTGDLANNTTALYVGQPALIDFVAPATGVIRSVRVQRLGSLDQLTTQNTLYVSVGRVNSFGDLELLGEQQLVGDFTRINHPVGETYTLEFAQPIAVTAGETYTFKAEALTGTLVTGSVMLTEGDWDDRITTIMVCSLPDGMTLKDDPPPGIRSYNDCNGITSAYALFDSYDMALSYPIDDEMKRESVRDALHNGDYMTITSNRFYDSEARNLLRFPWTTRYYDALFAGKLGYELIQTFNTSYEFMGLSVSDQQLPTYGSPLWFNEFEPDEAFHVYDHPATFVFRKTADYDRAAVDRFLYAYPLDRVETQVALNEPGSNLIGAVYWDSLTMDSAPNGLMQAPDQKALNQAGGTWSERFDSDSALNTNQPLGVAVWWLALVGYGWLAFPILFTIFPQMPDRGYGFAKLIGMFLVAYLAWFMAGIKVPMWSQAGIVVAMIAVGGLSVVLAWRQRVALRTHIRLHWRQIISLECLALIVFIAFIGLRLSNPDLWHAWKGGEKPMDFAMFNSVLRATTFPSQDVWFAGGNLNYYYWGYVLVGSPILLLQIVPAFAYNLAIPTVAMLVALGAYSTAYNIVAWWRDHEESARLRIASPVLAGIAALLLCVVLGNLDTIRVAGNGLAQLGGWRLPLGLEDWLLQQTPFPDDPVTQAEISARAQQNLLTDRIAYEIHNSVSLVSGLVNGLQVLRVSPGAQLPVGTDRWYWGPSRVLDETPGVGGGAITEMPAFTFIYGDLHAHMINMPILLFVIAFVFSELVNARQDTRSFGSIVLSLLVGGAVVGMIQAINTWDLPAFLIFGVIGLGYAWWLRFEHISRQSLTFLLGYVGGFLIFAMGASLPYRTWFAATYGSVELWQGGRTPFWAYVDIWGVFLFLLVSLLLAETYRWLADVKVKDLRGRGTWLLVALIGWLLVLAFLIVVAALTLQVALIAIPLIVWIGVLFFRPRQSLAMQFVLVITGLALALTLGVEVVTLGGDIGRQNTVFKFYIQAWLLLSVAGGTAFAWLMGRTDRWSLRLSLGWFTPLFVLVFIAALFPIMATRGRSFDRMSWEVPLTLNGQDYMKTSSHVLTATNTEVPLAEDYDMIRWLQENVQGTPTIIEGRTAYSEYSWTARIAINTGLPSVLGWRFHQTQQRTFAPLSQLIDQREANIKYFYNTTDRVGAFRILEFFDVSYVIVGGLEKTVSSPDGIAKFDAMVQEGALSVAFTSGNSTIYAVNRDRFITTGMVSQ